ncbi:hypothetical protein [Chamaesiphon sp.]|uniref:deazapurine DNA modification protein DpdA family protein n=1 Tax=Chamaesiphon sp. TaxID=2814140 RepID=UPI003593D5A0
MQHFYSGWHQINSGKSGTKHFPRCLVSAPRLQSRRSLFPIQNWILDCGTYSRFHSHGQHLPIDIYATLVKTWQHHGCLDAWVSQDWLCHRSILKITNMSIYQHQQLTIDRYDRLLAHNLLTYLMPVLQGDRPTALAARFAFDYVCHLEDYGKRLAQGQWVGVGNIAHLPPQQIAQILLQIKSVRPDLRLHGFGIKSRALTKPLIWDLLYSADSAAAGLSRGRGNIKYCNSNNPLTAVAYAANIREPNPTIFLQITISK